MVFSAEDHFFIKVGPANSPDLNLVDYRIWGKLQERVYRNRIRDVDRWSVISSGDTSSRDS